MKFIQGKDRTQSILFPESLDQIIGSDNEVRMIDLFVESISLERYQFCIKSSKEGRPAYHPKDLLKLFVYGYLNHIRSSRQLEKECLRNIELMWLMKQLVPDHNTISNFRRDNEKSIRKVFRHTVSIAKHFDLIGATLVAGDSTKLRGQNSRKNNFNEAKIERHLTYINAKLDEYNKALSEADADNKEIKEEIKKYQVRRINYQNLNEDLKKTGESQISSSDPDCRKLITGNNNSDVGYNVQTVVDAKHSLIVDYKVTNENDTRAMSGMIRRTKTILGTSGFTALYDKGYHTGIEIKKATELDIKILVAIPGPGSFAPAEAYNFSQFKYDELNDIYICPQQQVLKSTGKTYQKSNEKYTVKHYKTTACKTCPVSKLCTRNKNGRLIERSEYASYIEQNRINIENNQAIYKKRQAIVEHPYGTIKRQWGFSYIMTKSGIKRASSDVGLMLIAYNLRRLLNIVDKTIIKSYLHELALLFFALLPSINGSMAKSERCYFTPRNTNTFFSMRLNRFVLS